MRMYIGSILVNDVAHAHDFYVGTLGFQVKDDVTHGDFRWLTITNPTQLAEDGSVLPGAGMEIVLEPKGHPATGEFTEALRSAGIPLTQFLTDSLDRDYAELKDRGVEFTMEPTDVGPSRIAVFDDSCGNLIQIVELKN